MTTTFLLMSGCSNAFHIENLASVILNARQKYERNFFALLLDRAEDVLFAQCDFARTRGELNDGVMGI